MTLPSLSSPALYIQGQLNLIYSGLLSSKGQKAALDHNLT